MPIDITYIIIAKKLFDIKYKNIINLNFKNWTFEDDETIVTQLVEMLESEDEIDIDKNDSKTMSAIAKELLALYRKSIQPGLSKEQISINDWGNEYSLLLRHHDPEHAEALILEKIKREMGTDSIHAMQILKKSIEEKRKKDEGSRL